MANISQGRPCRRCGKTIVFIQTASGKPMPCDAFSAVTILDQDGQVRQGFIPHWSTCPHADSFRRSGRAPTGVTALPPASQLAMRLWREIEARGGDPGKATFGQDGRSLVVTCPRREPTRSAQPNAPDSTPTPQQPQQRSLLDETGEPNANGPTDVGGYAEDSGWSRAASRTEPDER